MNYRRIVPNSISGTSLILGILAIFKSFEGDFFWAPIFIILAVLADACDGRAARLLKCQGEFGVQLDSLCDLGSFGVAPAIMIYQYALTDLVLTGQIIAGLFTFAGAMRLARFNVNASTVHGYFQGMPIPAGACCLATYVLSGFNFGAMNVAVMTFIIAILLYSEVKFPDCKGKGNPLGPVAVLPLVIALVIGGYLLLQNPQGWPFVLMFIYTLAGVLNFFYRMVVK